MATEINIGNQVFYPIKGYSEYYVSKSAKFYSKCSNNFITPYKNNQGYSKIRFYGKNRKHVSVHRILAKAFIPNPENKPEVNHKNGIRDDNRLENLEWCTHKENVLHSYQELNRLPSQKGKNGVNHHRSVPVIQLSESGKVIEVFESMSLAKEKTGISTASISSSVRLGIKGKGYYWRKLINESRL